MHYLDHAATTPVPAAVAAVMTEVLTQSYGNPSAQYALGRQARDLVERSRGTIARALACRPEQVVFTSCGTEGDNWAIRAALYQNRRVGKHIITTAAEHSAVLQCLKKLEQEGYAVTYLKPDGMGRIAPRQVEDALRADTALVSVMLVNNETGVRFPVEKAWGCRNELLNANKIFLADKGPDWKKAGLRAVRLLFTTENGVECAQVLERYLNQGKYQPNDFTRGLYYRDVE